jgi:hypothetical protein
MAWLSITFEIPAADVEAVSDALIEAGALSVDVTDADAGSPAERPVFDEPGTVQQSAWQRARVSALAREGADPAALLAGACAQAGIAAPPHRVEPVAEQDWVRASRDQFAPIRISPRLWIVPSWREPPDRGDQSPARSGTRVRHRQPHPPRLCLAWLGARGPRQESVLDYGCGSGVLAIAASEARRGAREGVDIDERRCLRRARMPLQSGAGFAFSAADDISSLRKSWSPTSSPTRSSFSRTHRAADRCARPARAEPGYSRNRGRVRTASRRGSISTAPAQDDGWTLLTGARRCMSLVTNALRAARRSVSRQQLQAHNGKVRCGTCADGVRRVESAGGAAGARAKDETLPAAAAAEASGSSSNRWCRRPRLAEAARPRPRATGVTMARRRSSSLDEQLYPRKRRRPGARAWAAGAALLALALAGQAVYVYRGELAAQYPALRPYLVQLCEPLRCTVAPPQRPKQIAIEASDLQAMDASRPGLIQLTATLRNHAGHDLGYPAIDLVLTNTKEHHWRGASSRPAIPRARTMSEPAGERQDHRAARSRHWRSIAGSAGFAASPAP